MAPSSSSSNEETRSVILFQGDSITDAGRRRNEPGGNQPQGLGSGYVNLAASDLLSSEPGREWICYNRGVGGDRVSDLAARWDDDCLSLEPDVLSILVGVNDFWYAEAGTYEQSAKQYEQQYRVLLDRTYEALPDVTLLLGEPFAVPGGAAVDDDWNLHFDRYRRAARRVADDYGATWIPYQSVFDAALQEASVSHWAPDGVHPTPAGHYRMATAWLSAFQERQ